MKTKPNTRSIYALALASLLALGLPGCIPSVVQHTAHIRLPEAYNTAPPADTSSTAPDAWSAVFDDPYLAALIDTALARNQELSIMLQEVSQAKSEVMARKGDYLPFVDLGASGGLEKAARYTREGATDEALDIRPGQRIPTHLGDLQLTARVSWEVDIWKKLRNAKQAAFARYLASTEAQHYLVTQVVAEVAKAYFQLLALDGQRDILEQTIAIQQEALQTVRQQKEAAKATELAVQKFRAEVLMNQGRRYAILQQITETENRLNLLLGRYPQPIPRANQPFEQRQPPLLQAGLPAQLMQNRPDIRQAEHLLEAAKLDVKVARAGFFPSLTLGGAVGFRAFNPALLFRSPESILYSLAGDIMAPLFNRKGLKASYAIANARQAKAVTSYERTVLQAYMEVSNYLAKVGNIQQGLAYKQQQTEALIRSVDISGGLFRSARADYMEVLMTQRDAMDARFELVELKREQLQTMVDLYQALGGGWRRPATS